MDDRLLDDVGIPREVVRQFGKPPWWPEQFDPAAAGRCGSLGFLMTREKKMLCGSRRHDAIWQGFEARSATGFSTQPPGL